MKQVYTNKLSKYLIQIVIVTKYALALTDYENKNKQNEMLSKLIID